MHGSEALGTKIADPFIGRTIADRYEITSLISIGGMGRVYRANQRSLGREVAIKFVHPHLLGSDILVQRFMMEAQAVSRLNHPHVVSVFDFGQMLEADGGHLFLVMELLAGESLATVLLREAPLPFARITAILRQTLEALGEAHRLGITHRDVKPDNIILAQWRSFRDFVKVIDFGIAKMEARRRITESGQVCGTPAYMAPEQGFGEAIDPRADLYSVGVMMFELLTGKLPFEGLSPVAVMLRHMRAERPDPRKIAPQRDIPDALATACLHALEIDPRRRFQTAEEFEETLADCAEARTSSVRIGEDPPLRSQTPTRTGLDDAVEHVARAAIEATILQASHVRRSFVRARSGSSADDHPGGRPGAPAGDPPGGRPRAPADDHPGGRPRAPADDLRPAAGEPELLLLDRAQEITWALDLLARRAPTQALAFWGRTGVGRTRLLDEVIARIEPTGAMVIQILLPPAPRGEIAYGGLRAMILRLSGRSAEEIREAPTLGRVDSWVNKGLDIVFNNTPSRLSTDPMAVRRSAAAALGWAARRATERPKSARVVMAIDDLERLDGASRIALDDLLRSEPIPGFSVVMTGERSPRGAFDRVPSRLVRGLSRADAARMLASGHQRATLSRFDEDIEPLYVAELQRIQPGERRTAPALLPELCALRVQELPPSQRRALQALAVVGSWPQDRLSLLPNLDMTEALVPLMEGGFVTQTEGEVTVTHTLFSRAAIATAPGGVVAELHAAAADAIADRRAWIELRAYHAIRGRADFQAFLMVEEAARIRTSHGDDQGAIATLWGAVGAARSQLLRGEIETASAALSVFGRKLATALANDDRLDEAKGVLDEVLEVAHQGDIGRALLLEQLAAVAQLRGQADEALTRRREALVIAERCGDADLAERLRAFVVAAYADPGGDTLPVLRGAGRTPALGSMPAQRSRPVLVVEDDKSIREGLKAVIESDGREAFVASNGREALEVLRKIPRPGLILLDLMMPVMTGWELLANLQANDAFSTIPVVVVSAVPSRDELAAARVVQKPVEVGMLLNIVQEFCG